MQDEAGNRVGKEVMVVEVGNHEGDLSVSSRSLICTKSVEKRYCDTCASYSGKCRNPKPNKQEISQTHYERAQSKREKIDMSCHIPSRRHASDTQCTAKASLSSSPSSRTAKRTNTSSRISPNTWNGRLSISSHIGLHPLFLTVLVRFDTWSADVFDGGDE
jgi:hypothetical protein